MMKVALKNLLNLRLTMQKDPRCKSKKEEVKIAMQKIFKLKVEMIANQIPLQKIKT